MDTIEMLEESEYNAAGELLGLDALALNGELAAQIGKLSPMRKAKMLRKMATGHTSRGSRREMEKFFKELPKHIKEELARGKLRLADTTIYSIKKVNSRTVKMFETQDDKEVSIRNISNAKLDKNFAFLCSGVTLLAGQLETVSDGGPDIDVTELEKAIAFKGISEYPALSNGEHSLKANKKYIIPEGEENRRFVTDGNAFRTLGFYKLDNPRLILDEQMIEFTVELGTMALLPKDTYLRVALHGTGTTP